MKIFYSKSANGFPFKRNDVEPFALRFLSSKPSVLDYARDVTAGRRDDINLTVPVPDGDEVVARVRARRLRRRHAVTQHRRAHGLRELRR